MPELIDKRGHPYTEDNFYEYKNHQIDVGVVRKGELECPNGCDPKYFMGMEEDDCEPFCGKCRKWADNMNMIISNFGYLQYRK